MQIRQSQTEEEAPINLMPLIDMVFLLLIFFLVATTFAREERDNTLQLPGTDSARPLSALPKYVIINVAADGTTKVGGLPYDREALGDMLKIVAKDQPDRDILIRADERGVIKHFAEIVDLCHKAGINELKIGYLLQTEGFPTE